MSYLTRIQIPAKDAARLRLSDSYAWHRTLWRAFPNRDAQKRDFLTRIDSRGSHAEALILSMEEPTPQPWGRWETKQIPNAFLQHEQYRFSLRANPTVKRVVRDEAGDRKKNGPRTGIFEPDELKAWLARKAEQAGFCVDTARFAPPVKETFWKGSRKGTHVRVDFDGVLTVKDRELFKEAFFKGIGPARAFGFGMLLLQPLA